MEVEKLITKSPFKDLFPVDPKIVDALTEDMLRNNYDHAHPITIWKELNIVIDGHSRLEAAKRADIKNVPTIGYRFQNEEQALEYAIHNQRNRRNLTDAEILRCIEALDKRKKAGRPAKELAQDCANFQPANPESSSNLGELSIQPGKWLCPECCELFPIRVCHCLHCDHHYPPEDEECSNCHNSLRGAPQAECYEKSEAPVEVFEKPASSPKQPEKKSAQKTAAMMGISARKVEQARTVLEHGEEEVKEAVQAGTMSVNKAYQLTQEARQAKEKGRSVFNRTNDNIEWACWTWNPVTGCKHDCPYCYARDIAARFYGNDKFDPKFHPERLGGPANTKLPQDGAPIGERNVFVCSMADLFGAWVPQEWIDAVMEEVRGAPQWNFLFLTKNPGRLVGIDWPPNAWVGTTVDSQDRGAAAEKAFARIKATVKFLSCEPLLEEVRFQNLKVFDWIIIGPRRVGKEHEQPQWEWVESLLNQARAAGLQVYFKPHLSVRPREYPNV